MPAVFIVDDCKQFSRHYQPMIHQKHSGYVPCPQCSQLMHRRNWGSHLGVIVDVCDEHGSWFDERKIEKIKEFIGLGGIEYEKFRYTQRGLNELHESDHAIRNSILKHNIFS